MAAGLGFKTFTSGEVLTSADVNGYLMQGVGVFTDAANRDAEITSPQEGQFAYLKDTNVTTYYTGSAWANLDTTGMTNPMTTTGDTIYSSSGSTPARLGIGSTGQVLTVAAGIPSWATPASGSTFSGSRVHQGSATSIPDGAVTVVNFNTEIFDVDGYHDNSTNNSRFTIPSGKAGYVAIYGILKFSANTTGHRQIYIRKNGATRIVGGNEKSVGDVYSTDCQAYLIDNCAVGDYYELAGSQDSGSTLSAVSGANGTNFMINYLGA